MTLSMHLKGDFIMSKEFDNKEFFFDVYDVILLTFKLNGLPRNFRFKSDFIFLLKKFFLYYFIF